MARSLHGGVNKSPQPELSDAREIHRDAGSIRRLLAGNACPPPRGTAKQGGGSGQGRRNASAIGERSCQSGRESSTRPLPAETVGVQSSPSSEEHPDK